MELKKLHLIDQAIDDLGGKWIGDGRKFDTLAKARGVYFTYHGRYAPIPCVCTYAEFEARKAERQMKSSWVNAPCWAVDIRDRYGKLHYTDGKYYCQEVDNSARWCAFYSVSEFPIVSVRPEKIDAAPSEVSWYDYETQDMRKNALPGAGEVCECFDFERNEFVKVRVLDAATHSREAAVATINGDSFGYVYWGCKFRPLDWNRNQQSKPEPDLSPELSFHLSNAFNELQAGARLLPENDARKQVLVSLASGVSVMREGV